MELTGMQIFWAVLALLALIGFGVLVYRQTKAGKDVGVPTSFQSDTKDAPPAGSDAYTQEGMRRAESEAQRKHDEVTGIHHKQRL